MLIKNSIKFISITLLVMLVIPFVSAQDEEPRIVFLTNDSRIATIATDGTDLQYLTESGAYYSPEWSPNGEQILYMDATEGRNFVIINADGTGDPVVIPCSICSEASWSPDGTRLAYTSSDGMREVSFHIITIASGETSLVGTFSVSPYIGQPKWSPDGQKLAALHTVTLRSNNVSANVGAPIVANVNTGQIRSFSQAGSELGWSTPIWLPDSRQVSLGISFGGIYNFDTQNVRMNTIQADIPGTLRQFLNNDVMVVTQRVTRYLKLVTEDGEPLTEETPLDPFPTLHLVFKENDERYITIETFDELANYVRLSGDEIMFSFAGTPNLQSNVQPVNTIINRYDADLNLIDSITIDGESPHWGPEPLNPDDCRVTAIGSANQRSEPSTSGQLVGTLSGGQMIQAIGATDAPDGFTWWQLVGEGWVRGDLVNANPACMLVPRQ